MPFLYARVPDAAALPEPVRAALADYEAAAAAILDLEDKIADHDSPTARHAAAEADEANALSVAAGGKPKPSAEATRTEHLALLRAARSPRDLAAQEAELTLRHVLVEHRDAVLEHVRADIELKAAAYRRTIDALMAARDGYLDALADLEWAVSISDREVPNRGEVKAQVAPDTRSPLRSIAPSDLAAGLTADAARHERLLERDRAGRKPSELDEVLAGYAAKDRADAAWKHDTRTT